MADVGSNLCVYGNVRSAWWDSSQNAYFITFSNEAGSYYIVIYGWSVKELNPGDCVMSTGDIGHLGNSPVMTVDAYDLYHCLPGINIEDSLESAFLIIPDAQPS